MTADADLDLRRMRRERPARLQAQMAAHDVPALLVFGFGNLQYAAGVGPDGSDGSVVSLQRPAALVLHDDPTPHVFTADREVDAVPAELPADHVHSALRIDSAEGVADTGRRLGELVGEAERLGIDDLSPALYFGLGESLAAAVTDASAILTASKICKTSDEVECIRRAQHINETAMHDVQAALHPGVRQTDLSGLFLRRIFELGADANSVDPIWQPLPRIRAELPWTTNHDVAFPLPSTPRVLREGEVIWVDSGIHYRGYASDFGRTWIVGDTRPTTRQLDQCKLWLDIVHAVTEALKPGVSAGDLCRTAIKVAGGSRPWLAHFYLAHGVGTENAEMPLIGTDLGEAFDDSLVMAPGMVLVLEPVVWEEGEGGYRSEDIVVVTDTGYRWLSDYPYTPYDAR